MFYLIWSQKRKKWVYLAHNCKIRKLRVEKQTSAVFQTNNFLCFWVWGAVVVGVNDRKVFLQSVQCHKTDAADRLYWECYGMALWPLSLITSSQRTQFLEIGRNRGKQLHVKISRLRTHIYKVSQKNAISELHNGNSESTFFWDTLYTYSFSYQTQLRSLPFFVGTD